VNLDEYKGLSGEHDQSYRYFMNSNLFDHVNIPKERTYLPDGMAEDSDAECARYNQVIRSVGCVDMQLLGIGGNGHIGFNEPGGLFHNETYLVSLTQETREVNARFFASIDEVPTHAYTMGIKNIMSAKKILLLATGESKAKALREALFGPITPGVPASVLQLHNDVTVIADAGALKDCMEFI
jgi:glucosamine-6-phosphate deaminase